MSASIERIDRLNEIERTYRLAGVTYWAAAPITRPDAEWLMAEVKFLRAVLRDAHVHADDHEKPGCAVCEALDRHKN